MKYTIYKKVELVGENVEDVCAGHVYRNGSPVALLAQMDSECIYGGENKRGDLLVVSAGKRAGKIHELCTGMNVVMLPNEIGDCFVLEIPRNREKFFRGIRAIK